MYLSCEEKNQKELSLCRRLYRERFGLLQEAMRVRSMVEGHGNVAESVCSLVESHAERLSPRHWKALVHHVDRTFAGAASRLMEDALLGKEEILLFCYSAMGLGADTIADLLGLDSSRCVHARKYRLRRKIRLRCGPRRDEYLFLMD